MKKLCGFSDFESFQTPHRQWVETAVGEEIFQRESAWTQAVAVDSESFADKIKKQLKSLAIGRRIVPTTDGWELREETSSYNPLFGAEKVDIAHDNTYLLDESDAISIFLAVCKYVLQATGSVQWIM